jgi:hypothetical protein
MAMFATPRDLPDELLPYSGKLSDRFYEVRQNVAEFCQEIKAVEDAGWPEGSQDQLKAKARERGLWNFFLPEVSGITVMEYSPIAGARLENPSPLPPRVRESSRLHAVHPRPWPNTLRPGAQRCSEPCRPPTWR